MTKPALAALLMLALTPGGAFATIAPAAGALAPHATVRPGNKPRSARAVHCGKKADGLGVEGQARAIYLRKCGA